MTLTAPAQAAAHDGMINREEQEILRAIAAALNCPEPVLVE
ncbi:tellurite resistance protein [Ereboglobus sp. PH5-10]|nr:hypothetical protein [Ereboglobus sp. PH5-10]MDF9827118.1 tellurite resistance protein [Ereboglobus sp. PH5-10]